MDTSESKMVILTIKLHVQIVILLEMNHHVFDVLHASGTLSHGLGGVVGVAT